MIHGLHQLLAEKIAKKADGQTRLADPEISANERHSLEWTAEDLDREIVRISAAIREDAALGAAITDILYRLSLSPHDSRHRTLAFTHLEDAHSRLLRELGDVPG